MLLVEPEPETRKLAVFMLSKQGYQVLEARGAGEAYQLYEKQGAGMDLLLIEAQMSEVADLREGKQRCSRHLPLPLDAPLLSFPKRLAQLAFQDLASACFG